MRWRPWARYLVGGGARKGGEAPLEDGSPLEAGRGGRSRAGPHAVLAVAHEHEHELAGGGRRRQRPEAAHARGVPAAERRLELQQQAEEMHTCRNISTAETVVEWLPTPTEQLSE